MGLDEIADELYGLRPEEFTTARKERERQARDAGDKRLTAEIHALTKPNLVGWLLNQLARHHPDEVRALLELGSDLRQAVADRSGDQLRQLSHQQRQVVGSLVHHAERCAEAGGRSVGDATARSLEDSLRAAMADPDAGEALVSGRLTGGLQASGFGGAENVLGDRAGPPERRRRQRSPAEEPDEHPGRPGRDARREEAVAGAERAVAEAGAARQEAERRLAEAERSVGDATERVERLRRELHEAVKAQSGARRGQREAESALVRTERAAEDTRRRLTALTEDGGHRSARAGSPGRRRTT